LKQFLSDKKRFLEPEIENWNCVLKISYSQIA